MTRLVFEVDPERMVANSASDAISVLLYGSQAPVEGAGVVANDLRDKFERFSLAPSAAAMDLVSVAMAVTAADSFVLRDDAADGWRRELDLDLPLADPAPWIAATPLLQRALGFLSGDTWSFSFRDGGMRPPSKLDIRRRLSFVDPSKSDCVALFSGGLDSALGVLDLIDEGRRPLLVSHAGTGDSSFQQRVASFLPATLQRFDFNSYPSWLGPTEISSRTRSFQFIAVAALAAQTIGAFRGGQSIDLYMCENGLIALNPPLTSRRIGSLSTRTAHPHYLSLIRELFGAVGLDVRLENPHRHETKGEMLRRRSDRDDVSALATSTVSCGHWKRKGKQCGRCLPCLIRRASFEAAGVADATDYETKALQGALGHETFRDDIISVHSALRRRYDRNIRTWVLQAGPLPNDPAERAGYFSVAERGFDELEAFYQIQGLSV